MKKIFLTISVLILAGSAIKAQKFAYVDTDYILQDNKRKCHEYAENSLQLDQFMV